MTSRLLAPLLALAPVTSSALGQDFGPQQLLTQEGKGTSSVLVRDFDGDGDLDVISSSAGDDTIAWFENQGGGVFGARQVITTNSPGVNSVAVADLDGDGDLDVLAGSVLYDEPFYWFENMGGGTFGIGQPLGVNWYSTFNHRVTAVDLDEDGDEDILVEGDGFFGVYWGRNDGNGAPSSWTFLDFGYGAGVCDFAASPIDFDGDGDVDVISARSVVIGAPCFLFKNLGAGSFQKHYLFEGPYYHTSFIGLDFEAADLDGDGALDFVIRNGDVISWRKNGTGWKTITKAAGATSITVLDMDLDGDVDILVAGNGTANIFWLENDGSAGFGAHRSITQEAPGATGAVAVDLDGDGDPEVFSSSDAPDRVAWYENFLGDCAVSNYCSSSPNSTGAPARLGHQGSPSVSAADLKLVVTDAPPAATGVFFYSSLQGSLPFGDGDLCVARPIIRIPGVHQVEANGSLRLPLKFNDKPFGSGPGQVSPGLTWNFQFVFADPAGGPGGFNTTDGLSVTFCP